MADHPPDLVCHICKETPVGWESEIVSTLAQGTNAATVRLGEPIPPAQTCSFIQCNQLRCEKCVEANLPCPMPGEVLARREREG
jgi:hypothetical protein